MRLATSREVVALEALGMMEWTEEGGEEEEDQEEESGEPGVDGVAEGELAADDSS